MTHPHYGQHLVAWREKGVVSRRAKWSATAAFAVSILIGVATLAFPWILVPPTVAAICASWLWMQRES